MSLPFRTEILETGLSFAKRAFAKPLQLSSGVITQITEVTVWVAVRVNGCEARGSGSIYLSDLWAWPGGDLGHEEKDAAMRAFCGRVAERLREWCGVPHHPLEMGLKLHHAISAETGLPLLARAVCASPFDAALHDAVGQALGLSAFAFYEDGAPIPEADALFPEGGAVPAIRQLLRRPPEARLTAWWVVSGKDDLERDLLPLAAQGHYRSFKIKLPGKDNEADVARTVAIFRTLREGGLQEPRLSIDSNEGNPDAESVRDYLERLEKADPAAYAALEYLEQPTGRDISEFAYDWRPVASLKPVLLDEGLTGFDTFIQAKEQGWSGFALKTCKGHSFGLVAAAWGHAHGLRLAVQDLTNPGLAAIHSYLFSANLPAFNGVELNSPQYTPGANSAWRPRLDGLFVPRNGFHHLDPVPVAGLGSHL